METAVESHDLAGRFAEAFADQQEAGLSLFGGGDWRLQEDAVGVELRELRHERLGNRVSNGVSNGVRCQILNSSAMGVAQVNEKADRRRITSL